MAPVATRTKDEPATSTESPLHVAQRHLSDCRRNVREWEQRVAEADSAVENAAGVAVDDSTPDALKSAALGLAELRAEADLARVTLNAARKRADRAQVALFRAEADEAEAEAEEAGRIAAEHQARVRALVDQIEALEGVPYVPPRQYGRTGGQPRSRPEGTASVYARGNYASTQPDYANASCRRAKAPRV
jgi:hypothetical protein